MGTRGWIQSECGNMDNWRVVGNPLSWHSRLLTFQTSTMADLLGYFLCAVAFIALWSWFLRAASFCQAVHNWYTYPAFPIEPDAGVVRHGSVFFRFGADGTADIYRPADKTHLLFASAFELSWRGSADGKGMYDLKRIANAAR